VGQADSVKKVFYFGNFTPEVALIDLDLGPGPNGIDIATALQKS
jgi:hypothetical protein